MIETIILFSKEDKREEVVVRINKIFIEEGSNWRIIKHLITRNTGEGLEDIVNQLKDDKLRLKLNTYYNFYEQGDFISCAKISSDILNIIFSDFLQSRKKQAIESLKDKIVDLTILNENEKPKKKEDMKLYIDELLCSSKNLSNNIFDVRHSEKSTIRINNPFIYKLISNNNISLIEFVISSLKDEFILTENWGDIKNEYIEKYNIDKNTTYYYPEKEDKEAIKPEDIPF